MQIDKYGQQIYSEMDLCDLFLQDPDRVLQNVLVDKLIKFDDDLMLTKQPKLRLYEQETMSVDEFDNKKQAVWFMPDEYVTMNIAKWVLDQCKNDEELQRAGDELIKYNDRDMFVLLRYCKYLVDTMRKHNIVWGVGRGSSVASFVLYLIGIHRIDSLYYGLSIDEFLK